MSFSTTAVVADDATNGISSIATHGGQKLIEDPYGRMIVVYIDRVGELSVTYANSNPTDSNSWAEPVKKSGPVFSFKRPASVLVSPDLLQIIVEDGTGLGHINSYPVNIQRDFESNIVGLSFGPRIGLDTSNTAGYPSAILAHNGDIVAVWWHNDTDASRVRSFRWRAGIGWVGLDGSSPSADDVIVDNSNRYEIFPNIIQRPDNGHLYLVGNREETSSQRTLVFNKATFNGSGWSWGTQDLAYETNSARGFFDAPSLAWDQLRQSVVAAYDISGQVKYGVFTLNALDAKVHVDTPNLEIANNEWGNIQVDPVTGDYYLFMVDNVDPIANHDNGRVGHVRFTGGKWTTSLSVVDQDTNNVGISVRRVGSSPFLDFVFSKSGGEYYQIHFARIVRPDALYAFAPTDDATILLEMPDVNLGTSAALEVDTSPVFKEFLVKFTLSGLRNHLILGAKLRLHSVDSSGNGGEFYASSPVWSELNVTWNNAPARGPVLVGSLGDVSTGQWYDVDVSSAVTGDGDLSFRITTSSSDGADYSSKEGANHPELVVAIGNRPPEIAPVSNPTISEQAQLALFLNGTDPDGDLVTWSLDAGAPVGLSLTTDGNLTWTPGEEDGPGNFTITVRVTDGVLSDAENVTLVVLEVNMAPTVFAPETALVYEGQTLSLIVSAADPDFPANTVSLSVSGLPVGASFDPSTGNFTWTPALGGAGSYPVNFTATDNGDPALSNMKSANITVVVDTSAPVWPSLLLSISNVTSTSMTLNWPAAADNVGISAYLIYRNGEPLITVAGTSGAHTVLGLSPNTLYNFLVQAVDPSNNLSVENPTASSNTLPSLGGSGGGGRVYLL